LTSTSPGRSRSARISPPRIGIALKISDRSRPSIAGPLMVGGKLCRAAHPCHKAPQTCPDITILGSGPLRCSQNRKLWTPSSAVLRSGFKMDDHGGTEGDGPGATLRTERSRSARATCDRDRRHFRAAICGSPPRPRPGTAALGPRSKPSRRGDPGHQGRFASSTLQGKGRSIRVAGLRGFRRGCHHDERTAFGEKHVSLGTAGGMLGAVHG
jgi:hypothetical protein